MTYFSLGLHRLYASLFLFYPAILSVIEERNESKQVSFDRILKRFTKKLYIRIFKDARKSCISFFKRSISLKYGTQTTSKLLVRMP